jgi:hypothetical protein
MVLEKMSEHYHSFNENIFLLVFLKEIIYHLILSFSTMMIQNYKLRIHNQYFFKFNFHKIIKFLNLLIYVCMYIHANKHSYADTHMHRQIYRLILLLKKN